MHLFVQVAALIAPHQVRSAVRARACTMSEQRDQQFRRGSDLLQVGDDVLARQVVNVLGRWRSHSDWNFIGLKGKLDDFRSGDYYDDDVAALQTDFTKPKEFYIARRPQFLNFCERCAQRMSPWRHARTPSDDFRTVSRLADGLVARWVHTDNVALLPFNDAKLAASVNATVEELNAEPIDPVAAEIVFDALAGSMAAFATESQCDERRARFTTADGAFDATAFSEQLDDTRRNNLGVLTFGPGLGVAILGLVGYRWLPVLAESSAQFTQRIEANLAIEGPAALLLPGFIVGVFLLQSAGFVPSAERSDPMGARSTAQPLNWQERAIQEQDELFLERMRAKKRGGAALAEAEAGAETPKLTDETWKGATAAYFGRAWRDAQQMVTPTPSKSGGPQDER